MQPAGHNGQAPREAIGEILKTPLGQYVNAAYRVATLRSSRFVWSFIRDKIRDLEDAIGCSKNRGFGGVRGIDARPTIRAVVEAYERHRKIIEARGRGFAAMKIMDGQWGGGLPESKVRVATLAHFIQPVQTGAFAEIDRNAAAMWNDVRTFGPEHEWTRRLAEKDKAEGYPRYFAFGVFESYFPAMEFMDSVGQERIGEYCRLVEGLRREMDRACDGISAPARNTLGDVFKGAMAAVLKSAARAEFSSFLSGIADGIGKAIHNTLRDEMNLKIAAYVDGNADAVWKAQFPDRQDAGWRAESIK